MKREALEFEPAVVVDVIEMQEREHSWVRPPALQVIPNVRALQMGAQQTRSQTPRPLVKVSYRDAGASQLCVVQYFVADKSSSLVTPFDERRAKVNVENVQQSFRPIRLYDYISS